ncbi:MAG: phage protease [Pseudomonadota bacterium]|nr:phage protease [Pseudomonadota bacterium]
MTATTAPKANISPSALNSGAAVRILPSGAFRAHDGRPSGLSGWLIDASIAAALPALKPIGSSDWLIDYEHQSINSGANGKPVPVAGWFKRLEWREGDGLYMADITWTDTARAMIAASEYRHISPVFSYNDRTGAVTSVVLHA